MKFVFCSFCTNATNRKGFTLLELLVVVMIIGLLTSIAVPQYNRSVRRAEMMEGLSHGKTIYDAALRYKSVNGEGPTNFNQLDIGFAGATINGSSFVDGNFTYILYPAQKKVTVQSNVGGYQLDMPFPTVSSTGVSAPILCCPNRGDKNAEWLCKTSSGGATASGGCYEIK